MNKKLGEKCGTRESAMEGGTEAEAEAETKAKTETETEAEAAVAMRKILQSSNKSNSLRVSCDAQS